MIESYDDTEELADFAAAVAGDDRAPVVVIAGCGTAPTVTGLRERGVDAYGFDAEPEILETADPATREFLVEADLRDEALLETLRDAFGIDEIDLFVTECMLSFLTVDEARTALARIREAPGVGRLVHRVRMDPPVSAQLGEIDVTILTPEEWREACDPDGADVWRDGFEPWNLPTLEDADPDGATAD
ncbi:class I SAM-dependent methyltransferase [Natrialbaceae archaeon GCM10025810]|uniref:class I SAM-dependent methyltransferase n=1 Tax=Halovalidus salilacus TaxID=3075124 RepID=UPI0036109820